MGITATLTLQLGPASYTAVERDEAAAQFVGSYLTGGDYQQMDKQELHRQLEQLHAELQQVELPDSNERETLQKLAADIRKILEPKEDPTPHYGGLSERLREAIAQLEASHPKATMLMGQVLDQLAYLGV